LLLRLESLRRSKNFLERKSRQIFANPGVFGCISVIYVMRQDVAFCCTKRWTAPKLVLPFSCVEMTRPPVNRGVMRRKNIKTRREMGTKEE
jgi:hypothetical protein